MGTLGTPVTDKADMQQTVTDVHPTSPDTHHCSSYNPTPFFPDLIDEVCISVKEISEIFINAQYLSLLLYKKV